MSSTTFPVSPPSISSGSVQSGQFVGISSSIPGFNYIVTMIVSDPRWRRYFGEADPLYGLILFCIIRFIFLLLFATQCDYVIRILITIPYEKAQKHVHKWWKARCRPKLKEKVKVAVIGAGVGGSSVAYFLKDELDDQIELYVYESSNIIGGRCKYIPFPIKDVKHGEDSPKPSADSSKFTDGVSSPNTDSKQKREVPGFPKQKACKKNKCLSSDGYYSFETGGSIISELNLYFQYFMKLGHFQKMDRNTPSIPNVIFGNSRDDQVFASVTNVPSKIYRTIPLKFIWRLKLADAATLVKIIRKYGFFQLKKLKGLLKKKKVLDFGDLYKALNRGESFKSVKELIEITGENKGKKNHKSDDLTSSDLLEISACDTIKKIDKDLLDPVLNDLVSPNMRCNYGGQGLHALHGFVGMVSVAGGIATTCFNVAGGNREVFQHLIEKETHVDHLCLNTKVEKVELVAIGKAASKYTLHLSQQAHDTEDGFHVASGDWKEEGFDVVIYAGPMINKSTPCENTTSKIVENLRQFPSPKDAPVFSPDVFPESSKSKYRRCVCTLVQGELNQNFFNKRGKDLDRNFSNDDLMEKYRNGWTSTKADELPYLSALTSTDSPDIPFYSVSILFPNNTDMNDTNKVEEYLQDAIDNRTTVFKVFSPAKLTEKTLKELFLSYDPEKIHVDDWLAYPEYNIPQKLGDFVLAEGEKHLLLYPNAIENSAGAMEMSAIGGKNCANYAVNWLKRNVGVVS